MLFTTGSLMADHLSGRLLFSARLTGDQEVPSVETDATGVGSFFLNANRDSLCLTITVQGLSGPITGAHIHEGAMGENGDVLVGFTDQVDGNQIQATVTGEDLTPGLLEMMLDGELYFNVHTEENPAGEIRGQIVLERDWSFHADLDPEQEVEDVVSDARGIGVFNLSKTGMEVNYHVVVNGLTGPITGAHLHEAPAGMAGDVIVGLTDSVDGNVISGSFDPTEFEGLMEDMQAGNIYINVHTEEYPAGEIRGQLILDDERLSHDVVLNTEQEMPAPMGANGHGSGWVSLNHTMDTLFYRVQTEGLTGPITGAHFHNAPAGENGDVLIGVTDNVDGNRISGFVTGSALTTENINLFLSGQIYLNVHTEMNAPGEIRGQVYKLAREGYTYKLTGDQEVPSVDTDAYGSGMVSIDRHQSNVHFMMVYNDLSGVQTMSHFHNGAAGENGDVIYTLTDFFDVIGTSDAAFGYWTDMDENPFDAMAAQAFRGGNVYVNVHTSSNPNGELRGQVTRSSNCADFTVGLADLNQQPEKVSVMPNPATNVVRIDMSGVPAGNYQVTVFDITGKQVESTSINSNSASQTRLDVSDYTEGLYNIRITGDKGTFLGRVVKR